MKLANCISLLVLLLLGSTAQSRAAEPLFHFNWEAQSVDVVETCTKKSATTELIHHGQLIKTNDGFVLQWRPPTITEIDGEKVDGSKDLQAEAAELQKTMAYAAFRISNAGEFIEAISTPEPAAKANSQSEGGQKVDDAPANSEADQAGLSALYAVIWQTWVGAWTEVALADGDYESVSGMTEYSGLEVPVKNRTASLGSTTTDTNLVSLKFEQTVVGRNFQAVLNKLVAEGLEIKSAGPITNNCSMQRYTILEVQTERQTLKPHWAKRTTKTTFFIPGEQIETELEIREFNFQWGKTIHSH